MLCRQTRWSPGWTARCSRPGCCDREASQSERRRKGRGREEGRVRNEGRRERKEEERGGRGGREWTVIDSFASHRFFSFFYGGGRGKIPFPLPPL